MNALKGMESLEALYITGHSLGGAMAGLMAVMIRHERKYRKALGRRLRAVYTFGQPMIGDPGFAKACQEDGFLGENVIRYIYDRDIVPRLPPSVSGPTGTSGASTSTASRVSSGCSRRRRRRPEPTATTGRGAWRENTDLTGQAWGLPAIVLAGTAFVAGRFRLTRALPAIYSIDDHFPRRYIAALGSRVRAERVRRLNPGIGAQAFPMGVM